MHLSLPPGEEAAAALQLLRAQHPERYTWPISWFAKWALPKTGALRRSPYKQDHSIVGSIFEPAIFLNSQISMGLWHYKLGQGSSRFDSYVAEAGRHS